MIKKIHIFASILSALILATVVLNIHAQEISPEEINTPLENDLVLGELLFSVKDEINTATEIIDGLLYKGVTLYWDVKANTRYAVISSSNNVDTLQRLVIQDITVYRDLYLGEHAGIVFTPNKDQEIALTVFSTGRLDGTFLASDFISIRQQETLLPGEYDEHANTNSKESILPENMPITHVKIGEYTVQVYQLPSNPNVISLPYKKQDNITLENNIAHRNAKEYRVELTQDSRIYARLSSEEFDSLLEISDRFGRTIVSDDWGEQSSLITFIVPSSDEYFVTASSFDGLQEGTYEIELITTTGEMIESINGQITPDSPKILRKYASEHILDMSTGDYITAEIQALDNPLEVAFVNNALNAIYFTTLDVGETSVIPLYASQNSTYKLLIMSNTRVVANYIVTLYQ